MNYFSKFFSELVPKLDLFLALITLEGPIGLSEHTSEQRPDTIRQSAHIALLSIWSTRFQTIFSSEMCARSCKLTHIAGAVW